MIKPVEQLQGTDIRKVNDDTRDSLMQICPASPNPFSNQDEILNDSSSVTSEETTTYDDDEIFRDPYRPGRQKGPSLKIVESHDTLISKKDNHVIFIIMEGTPFDKGSIEYAESNKLPEYHDLMYERAKVSDIGNKILIALPLKINDRISVNQENVISCIRSLMDVIKELGLTTISLARTEFYDKVPRKYMYHKLKQYLRNIPVTVTICKALVKCPAEDERKDLIYERHATKIGGHKGVTKTYNRLRQNYLWPSMKKNIQNFIRNCRDCQIKN